MSVVGSENVSGPGGTYGLKCFAASKASSGDFTAVLFSVGVPYYTKPKEGQSRSVVPEAPPATYQVEEVHRLVFMLLRHEDRIGSWDGL